MDIALSQTVLFIIIFIYIIIIIIFIYCTYFNNNYTEMPPRNEDLYKNIILKKREIITNINIYSCIEINYKINEIIDLYIINKCDFIEDYDGNIQILIKTYKKQLINPSLYNSIKRNQIISYLKQQLKVNYKNNLISISMYNINTQRELLSNDDIEDYITTEIAKVKTLYREYKTYINQLFISIDECNEVGVIINVV